MAILDDTTRLCYLSAVDLYQARVACRVCGVTQRMLDHWTKSRVVEPSRVYVPATQGRTLNLFSFDDLVAIRLVKAMRDAGVSLQRIRKAIQRLRREGQTWKAGWLVTDGRDVYLRLDSEKLETLAGGTPHQLAFSVVALGHAHDAVKARVAHEDLGLFSPATPSGKVIRFSSVARPGAQRKRAG